MALSDSMFLLEVLVEELQSFTRQKFSIKSQFVDVFSLYLRKPDGHERQPERKPAKRKFKVSRASAIQNYSSKIKLQTGQSVLLANSIEWLTAHMRKNPLQLSLWSKKYPRKKLGGTCIPWSNSYIAYLNKLEHKKKLQPVIVNGKYNIINKSTSKCIAIITLSIKLTHLKYINTQIQSTLKGINKLDNTKTIQLLSNNNDTIGIKQHNAAVYDKEVSVNVSHTLQGLVSNVAVENKEKIYSLHRIVKSDTIIDKHSPIFKSKSLPSLYQNKKENPLIYIFGCPNDHFGNRVYCVSYFTIENEVSGKDSHPQVSIKEDNQAKGRYHLKLSNSKCTNEQIELGCSQSLCSLNLPEEALVNITKCKEIKCDSKKHREPSPLPDDHILLDFSNIKKDCCHFTEKTEEVVGGIAGEIKIGDDPCFCSCECRFGFTKKTTYCAVCGGYEIVGEELIPKAENQIPFPCPMFHKLIDKSKLKNWSTSGSDSKKKDDHSVKSMKISSSPKATATTKRQLLTKSVEPEKDTNKERKKKDDRFKFNYGYKGIPPQIGHSECAMPCTGTLGTVPKNMGWLWTAEDVPGMKFRPMWKPGAINKHVFRLLRMAKNPGQTIAKKRRRDTGKKKRPLKRPLLIVHKRDGEYVVTMETMKSYSKARSPNQHPYEDKPVLTYTIGRTDEENRDRLKKKEREQRRLERAQRQFIQSAFCDMCQDICIKTYQQALGITPGAEDPECSCFTAQSNKVNVDVSCSCSEEDPTTGSDTDLDEWIVEFTPPNATFDPTYKYKKQAKADVGTQYTYLDYRVKLVDRFGNPVPRFFKGPDGKQQCSDLGGFWSPDGNWLEINVEGYIAPDGRWAPNLFIGPNGEQVDAETGKFQDTNGQWLVVGIDGYIDCTGKWRSYLKPRNTTLKKRHITKGGKKVGAGDKKDSKSLYKPSETSWSCFGDVSPKLLSKMGIVGHGQDKKILLSRIRDMIAHGEDVRIPEPSTVYRLPDSKKSNIPRNIHYGKSYPEDRYRCTHPVPSDKGIVAMDMYGNKTYFKLKYVKNRRPTDRLAHLANQGISVSSFHVPCFNSFINSELLKKQQRERLIALAAKSVGTQAV